MHLATLGAWRAAPVRMAAMPPPEGGGSTPNFFGAYGEDELAALWRIHKDNFGERGEEMEWASEDEEKRAGGGNANGAGGERARARPSRAPAPPPRASPGRD